MDRPDWEDFAHYQQRNVNPDYQRVNDPRSFSSQDAHSGEPLENDDDNNAELARKRSMLRHTEVQILQKKTAIAQMKIEQIDTELPSLDCMSAPLKDRVTTILQWQHSPSFLSKCKMFKMTPSHSKEWVPLEDHHFLKLRVKALMRRHRSDHPSKTPSKNPVSNHTAATPPVPPSPPRQSVTSAAREESAANKGFERFLSLLNKGVDLDLLNRIVNDDSEDFHLKHQPFNIQPCGVKEVLGTPIGKSGTLPPERTEQSTCQHYPGQRCPLSDDKHRKDRKERFGSTSPPTVEKKKVAEVDERCEQLQNILNTLGLSLEEEEMSQLTDRTQERLYGRRNESRQVASSGSCETSRKSSSRSRSRSPSGGWSSNSRNSMDRRKEKSFSECSESALNQDGAEAQTRFAGNNEDRMALVKPPHPHSHPDGDTFPGYSVPQYPQCNAPFNGDMICGWTPAQGASCTLNYPVSSPYSSGPYHFDPTAVSVDPRLRYQDHHSLPDVFLINPDLSLSECQFGPNTGLPRFLKPVAKQQPATKRWKKKSIQKRQAEREKWLRWKAKRQGVLSLQAPKASTNTEIKPATNVSSLWAPKASTNIIEMKRRSEPPKTVEPTHGQKCPEVELSKEGKRLLTDEEIKANLRKKLEAFNQKNKSHTKAKS
uniref:uncharacterized protein LOC131136360 n=1 Tax=Doryrhamphus excisus TaxID=161450 RepID=UPI0025AEB91E|nr:uncharacterized protein LOC131136360 [Doryrhamphus excisus]XP_057939139.1 uncharacterized protein LOC131136360 [Doryrhamphus excisus]XP_057939140.1 uncharacterized protein LOC131136360 [Doryrhamphus excisus]